MLFLLNKMKYLESSQGSTRSQRSSSCIDPRAHCAGTKPVPSGGAAAAARRQGLKRCHQAHDRCTVSALPVEDKDLVLRVQTVLQIRLPRPLEDERQPSRSSTAINKWPWSLLLEPVKGVMAEPLYNFATPWSCVRAPEHRAKVPSLGARRMLAKLGDLHQSLCPCLVRNPGAAWV
jgi:hypothetical protein